MINTPEIIHEYGLDEKNRVIYITKEEDMGDINPKSASTFCKNLDILSSKSDKPITIKMFCIDGGCIYSGLIMYEHIKNCKCYVTIEAYSTLCSMGTVIFQAADERLICPHMEMMIHFGSFEHSGETLAVKSYAEFKKNSHKKMMDIYSNRCKNGPFFIDRGDSVSKISSYLTTKIKNKGDFWMTAEDAIFYGFADSIIKKD